MSEYKGIKGFQVQTRSSDPVPYAQALADNPYGGAWASSGNVNLARGWMASAGTYTAGMIMGGDPGARTDKTELYDGSSWTEVNDLNLIRGQNVGAGLQTASITFGGISPPQSPGVITNTESWDGTNWTEVNDLNERKYGMSGFGTATAAVSGGGFDTAAVNSTETWDGTSWTEVNNMNTSRWYLTGAGTQTSGIAAVGATPSQVDNVETWNGSSWTEVSEANTARDQMCDGAGSSSTNALIYGGATPSASALTESWDGTSWTEVNDLATARKGIGAFGANNLNAVAASGATPTRVANTEEWSFTGLDPSTTPAADYADAITGDFYYNSTTGQFKTVNDGGAPIGTWASGASTNTEAGQRGSASRSSTSSAFVSGGFRMGVPDVTANAESYDGTSWTEGPNQPGTNRIGAAWGATNSYVTAGGSTGTSGAPINPYAFEWNGTSFSNGGQLNNARRNAAGAGVSETAGRAFAGGDNPGPAQAFNESYNGTAFTEETDLNTARIRPTGFGTTTAAIAASGGGGTNVESWDGSSWTEVAEVVVALSNGSGGAGTSTDGLIFCKNGTPPGAATCQFWNGTSFTEVADLSVNRYANAGGGANSTNAISVGGYGPPTAVTTSTELWSAGDFEIKSVTTS